jgi:hypothetical protein
MTAIMRQKAVGILFRFFKKSQMGIGKEDSHTSRGPQVAAAWAATMQVLEQRNTLAS